MKGFGAAGDLQPDVEAVKYFLSVRLDHVRLPVLERCAAPERRPDGWLRFPWKAFAETLLPE
eukprot:1131186-Alexandrium_andersonii.AAC.1